MPLIATLALASIVAMCDISRAMMKLSEYIEAHAAGQSKVEVARAIGISRSYLVEILNGTKKPGREAIAKIEIATNGAVPASVWFDRIETGDAA